MSQNTENNPQQVEHKSALRFFIAGTFAGMSGVFVGYPFDTIKVRLQTQVAHNGKLPYRSALDCLLKSLRREGFGGLYKGLSSPLLGDSLTNSIIFGVYNLARLSCLSAGQTEEDFSKLTLTQITYSGAAAGIVAGTVLAPVELIKANLQIQTAVSYKERKYTGPIHFIKKTVKEHGPLALTKGLLVTWMRDIPAFAAYFLVYEGLQRRWQKKEQIKRINHITKEEEEKEMIKISAAHQLIAGGFGGISAWIITYPVDVVKSRIQTSEKKMGIIKCVLLTYRNAGFWAFWNGIETTLLRAFPVNCVIFFVFEMCISSI